MARISHKNDSSSSSNPCSMFLEWKSNSKSFEYYNKEAGSKVEVKLPLRFVFLQHYHTVKGWNDSSESGIYSNEVYYIGSESMAVKSFKGGLIAEGIYKDIKPIISNAGGKYYRSVYVMLEDGSLANISIKGAAVKEWSDFFDNNKNLLDNQWVEVLSAKDQKKGSIKYSTPEFTLGKNLTTKEGNMADDVAETFKAYIDEYFKKGQPSEEDLEDVELGI